MLDCDTRSRAAAEELDATRADLLASQQLIDHHEGVLREELDRGIALHRAAKDHSEVALEEMRADLLVCQKLVDSMQSAAETVAADGDHRARRLEAQAQTLAVNRRELKVAKTQKETADKDYHSALDELAVTQSDHLAEASQLRAECKQLRAVAEQLRADLRHCTTCSPAGGAEDTCPAELAAALLRLQQAEARFRVLDQGYDALKAAADTSIAALETDLASARSARDVDSSADHARLERLRAALDASDHQLRQSQADARTIQEELTRLVQVIAEQRLTHLFYGNRAALLLGDNQQPPLPDTPGRPLALPDTDPHPPGYDPHGPQASSAPPSVNLTDPPCELTSGSTP